MTPQRYSVRIDESGGNEYRIEDIWADNYAEALWVAYGRAMRDRAARDVQNQFPHSSRFGVHPMSR